MKPEKIVVIGSGPSAVAAVGMLIKKGVRPHVIDAGDIDHKSLGSDLSFLRTKPNEAAAGQSAESSIATKGWFGSSYTYSQPSESVIEYSPEVGVRATFQLGGFSRIWGGTFDLSECSSLFPSLIRPTQEHLRFIEQMVPNSRTTFNSHADTGEVLGHTRFTRVVRALERNHRLTDVEVSSARLAINSRPGPSCCTGCHGCFVGCPVDAIWFAGTHMQEWVRSGLIEYQPKSVVTALHETDDHVLIQSRRRDSRFEVSASRVILAAGAVSSGAILVNSSICSKLRLQDTSASYGAALSPSRWRSSEVTQHGLSQVWIKFPNSHFVQLYAPDSVHLPKLQQRLSALWKLAMPISHSLVERLVPIVLMHEASHSDAIVLSKQRGRVFVEEVRNATSDVLRVAALKELGKSLRGTGLVLLRPFFEQPPVGTSQHVGASLPHLSGSDELGRPIGARRIHVVDGSVLPKLPLGSVTPLIMANAARIASHIPFTN